MTQAAPRLNDQRYIARDTFFYEISLTTALGPAQSAPGSVNIDTDSDFFWQKFTAHVAVGSAAQQRATEEIPEIDLTIKDATTGRDIMNAPVPLRNIAGTGEIPFILPVEKYFGARSQITCTFYNVSGGTTYSSVKITFSGIKAFLR